MMKRIVFLMSLIFCLLCCAAALADTVSLTTTVPDAHVIEVRLGEHGSVRYAGTDYSGNATLTVSRFDAATIAIVPDYGYKLASIRVSSGENLQVVGSDIQISRMVEDLTIELSFEKEWEPPTYAWSDDYSTVTATCVSKADPTITKSETAETVGAVTREPTCTEMGITTYTAEFNDPEFAPQQKEVANVDMIPHVPVVTPAVPATSVLDGTTKGITCSVCNSVLLEVEAISRARQIMTPGQLTAIEDEAFEGVDAHQIILSEGVTTIGGKAFANCPHLGIVYIPRNVRTIADDAFEGDELVTLWVEAGSAAYQYAVAHQIDYITD